MVNVIKYNKWFTFDLGLFSVCLKSEKISLCSQAYKYRNEHVLNLKTITKFGNSIRVIQDPIPNGIKRVMSSLTCLFLGTEYCCTNSSITWAASLGIWSTVSTCMLLRTLCAYRAERSLRIIMMTIKMISRNI